MHGFYESRPLSLQGDSGDVPGRPRCERSPERLGAVAGSPHRDVAHLHLHPHSVGSRGQRQEDQPLHVLPAHRIRHHCRGLRWGTCALSRFRFCVKIFTRKRLKLHGMDWRMLPNVAIV